MMNIRRIKKIFYSYPIKFWLLNWLTIWSHNITKELYFPRVEYVPLHNQECNGAICFISLHSSFQTNSMFLWSLQFTLVHACEMSGCKYLKLTAIFGLLQAFPVFTKISFNS